MPRSEAPRKAGKKEVYIVASGDLRLSANQVCWPAQERMEAELGAALAAHGYRAVRAHPYREDQRHGFIASQAEGMSGAPPSSAAHAEVDS